MHYNTYFDNAATSHPKPKEVTQAILQYLSHGGTYGRAAYARVIENTRMVEQCREKIATLIGCRNADNIAFTPNATTAINTILQGFPLSNTTIYHSPLEHNSVMRPLYHLQSKNNLQLKTLPADKYGRILCEKLKEICWENVSLVIVNHTSNVNGQIQPLAEIAKALPKQVLFMVDASQSLGCLHIDVEQYRIDFLAFTGHKGLLGPTGTGGFYSRTLLTPLVYGGTGSHSHSYQMPTETPDLYEAGTPNLTGIAGLSSALDHVPVSNHCSDDFLRFMEQVERTKGITVFKAGSTTEQAELFSFTHHQLSPSEIADRLSLQYGIEVRQGLHCAPLAHQTLGTFPDGTVRVSCSPYHTPIDFNYFTESLNQIIAHP